MSSERIAGARIALDWRVVAYTLAIAVGAGVVAGLALAGLMGVLGALTLVLALSGVYGVMAHSVTERTHEIGIRLALGAEQSQVLRWVASRGMRLTAIGLAIGMALAFVLARLAASLLIGASASDPMIFVAIPAALAVVALMAYYLPARRVDRTAALRYQ